MASLRLILWIALAAATSAGACQESLLAARAAYGGKQFEQAAVHFERALGECPDRVAVLLDLARARLMARQLDRAHGALTSLLAIDPRHAAALKLLGDTAYLLGNVQEAESALLKATAADPASAEPHYALGRIYYQESRYEDAAARFNRVIAMDPRSYRAYDNLGLAYEGLNDTPKAIASYKRAMDLSAKADPAYDWVYGNMSNLLYRAGDYENAFQFGAEAAQRNSGSPRNFFLTGKALFKLERTELAAKWLGEAVKLDPNYSEARYQYAQVLRKLGRTAEANEQLAAFRAISARQPKNRR